ncbi:ABC transporter substrate-binding protein [Bifidobacterium olomucense]|uniref:ABC transporter substrate-binding protein n=1 Tax=Bifidobacterium olomucense TaxID=2675324 RepID=A0A7Y0EX68_9BIFI|nr:extracellular solute-binding protein [Bifidobacterium sp. DSM 109959]NMM98060.1 ABC transporter substrate-binding protein [Bifidobacterium sp. DSM 109959]
MNRPQSAFHRITTAALTSVLMLSVGACGNSTSAGNASSGMDIKLSDIEHALTSDNDVNLTMWASSYEYLKQSVQAFEEKYPHIHIDFVNPGSQSDMMIKFQNAVTAKKGIPDILQFGYDSYPQFAVSGSLLNFKSEEIEKAWASKYSPSTWQAVHVGQGLYGLPQDQAPIAMYSRKDILQEHGLEIPKTWDEFYETGKKLHEADPSKYMGFIDVTDSKAWSTFYRQASAPLWKVENTSEISLSTDSAQARKVTAFLQKCLDDGVLKGVSNATDEFMRDINAGKYVTWIDENWRGGLIEKSYPSLAGKYTVTLPPAWGDDPQSVKTASGGSMLALSAAIPQEKAAAALAFMDWLNTSEESIEAFQNSNGFFFMASSKFQQEAAKKKTIDEFFGQDANSVYFESANKVNADWSYLPFLSQLNTYFTDVIAPALSDDGDLEDAINAFQPKVEDFAQKQGFTVNK